MKKTITINILNFNYLSYDDFISKHHIYEDKSKVMLSDILESLSLDDELLRLGELREKYILDESSRLEGAKEEGLKKGKEEGLK